MWISEAHIYRVFFKCCPNFQYQNEEKTSYSQPQLLFHEIFNVKKLLGGWSSFFFHFGTENGEEQLKKSTLYLPRLWARTSENKKRRMQVAFDALPSADLMHQELTIGLHRQEARSIESRTWKNRTGKYLKPGCLVQCVGPRCRMSIGCTDPRLGRILIPFNPCKVLSDTSP